MALGVISAAGDGWAHAAPWPRELPAQPSRRRAARAGAAHVPGSRAPCIPSFRLQVVSRESSWSLTPVENGCVLWVRRTHRRCAGVSEERDTRSIRALLVPASGTSDARDALAWSHGPQTINTSLLAPPVTSTARHVLFSIVSLSACALALPSADLAQSGSILVTCGYFRAQCAMA